MKKILILTSFLVLTATVVSAQKQYKVSKTSGKLVLNNIPGLSVEGYDGKEIIFTIVSEAEDSDLFSKNDNTDDPRARGLSALNNNGFDNTGLRLNISEKGNDIFVSPVGNLAASVLNIKIPNSVSLSIKSSGWPLAAHSGKTSIALNKIRSEVDVSAQFENFKLTDISGPLSIKTFNGNIELQLADGFKGPISVYSISGFVDITIPASGKADLTMSSLSGTIYADKSLKLEAAPLKKGDAELSAFAMTIAADSAIITTNKRISILDSRKFSGDSTADKLGGRLSTALSDFRYFGGSSSFNGTLNGGGQKVKLQTMSGKIYLRK